MTNTASVPAAEGPTVASVVARQEQINAEWRAALADLDALDETLRQALGQPGRTAGDGRPGR